MQCPEKANLALSTSRQKQIDSTCLQLPAILLLSTLPIFVALFVVFVLLDLVPDFADTPGLQPNFKNCVARTWNTVARCRCGKSPKCSISVSVTQKSKKAMTTNNKTTTSNLAAIPATLLCQACPPLLRNS